VSTLIADMFADDYDDLYSCVAYDNDDMLALKDKVNTQLSFSLLLSGLIVQNVVSDDLCVSTIVPIPKRRNTNPAVSSNCHAVALSSFIISPIAIAYSMGLGQNTKPVCVCQSVSVCIRQ